MSSPSAASGAEGCGAHPPEHLLRGLDLLPSDLVNVENGRSGFAWRVRSGAQSSVVRFATSAEEQAGRLAAMAAAEGAGLPVPAVLGQVADETGALSLLEWLPGVPLASFLSANPDQAEDAGRRFGRLQQRLHAVRPPEWVRPVSDPPEPVVSGTLPETLLHLDWHPYNVLVDADGEITGVIDWDNARRGDPRLDLARTWAMLTVEPSLVEQPAELRARLPVFVDGWSDGYGSAVDRIDDQHRRWVARVLLAEWRRRPLPAPDALAPLQRIARN